jgi:hypothetical protein
VLTSPSNYIYFGKTSEDCLYLNGALRLRTAYSVASFLPYTFRFPLSLLVKSLSLTTHPLTSLGPKFATFSLPPIKRIEC